MQTNVNDMHEYKQACLLAFTKTWLDNHLHVSNLLIDGFCKPIILDRNKCVTGKDHGKRVMFIL